MFLSNMFNFRTGYTM